MKTPVLPFAVPLTVLEGPAMHEVEKELNLEKGEIPKSYDASVKADGLDVTLGDGEASLNFDDAKRLVTYNNPKGNSVKAVMDQQSFDKLKQLIISSDYKEK